MYKYYNPYMAKRASAMPDTGSASICAKGAPVDKSARIRRMLDGHVSDIGTWMDPEDAMAKRAAYEEAMLYYPGDAVMRKVATVDPAAVGDFLKNNYGRVGMGILGLLLGAGLGRMFGGGTASVLSGAALGGTAGAFAGGSLQNTDIGRSIGEKYVNPAIQKTVDFLTPKKDGSTSTAAVDGTENGVTGEV